MKKNLILFGLAVLLICVGLSGCFEGFTSDVIGVWYEDGNDGKWTFYENKTLVQDYGEHGIYNLKWDMDSRYIHLIYSNLTMKYTYDFISDKTILLLQSYQYNDITLRRS